METPTRLAIKEAQTTFEGLAEELGLESEEDVVGQKSWEYWLIQITQKETVK